NRLEEILRTKREEIERLQPRRDELHRAALLRNDVRGFASALQREGGKLALVAEVKKASPSAGVIVESFDPVAIARNYARAGVEAISVLTDERFFQGHLDYLKLIREQVPQPLLRKDFILDPLQIMEAAVAGADAILLIVAALGQEQLVSLLETAALYQLDALVEVHTLAELDRALETDARVIGINNRNLATFEVDLGVTERLSEEVPERIVLVSESGIRTAEDLARIKACGVDAVLIGEALMRGQGALLQRNGG
ncbi:MAG TPA: indole-3-glycerol phosphate synthase TrpC, partial [Chthoniobacterales bacterium]|nr:indole-3-glycerol phosphate synthase TrpC [Chthoniobacterales bacterium]